MTNNVKFPPTVEIKRVLAAAQKAGVGIGSIEIHPRRITIHPKDIRTPAEIAYSEWKAGEKELTLRITPKDGQSGILPKKSGR